jgi:NADH-quinone oxidoreductase subunit M
MLTTLIVLLFIGGLVAWYSERWHKNAPRVVSLVVLSIHFVLLLILWGQYLSENRLTTGSPWLAEVNYSWIPQLGINYHLGLDGLSLLLILLTSFLGIVSVAASWKGIQSRVGYFHFQLLWILSAIVGAFLSLDLFLFYFFWEMMLVPLYFLIGIWGHENRVYATLKFFIFTQVSSLFMLVSILALYFIHGHNTGEYTFDYLKLIHTSIPMTVAFWIMLGFFVAFAVKLPAFPFHTWLPDAHTEAPTAGSVVLAGLVLKVGAYGFLRFVVPLFPQAASIITPYAMALGVIGILYGAIVAFGQTDFKRLVAYTSISHMGFVLIGIFAWNQLTLQGVMMVMLAHGISTGALFVIAGDLQDRAHTREMDKLGGLWEIMPRMGGSAMVFAVASLGLPGLGNFVGEILILQGLYMVSVPFAVLATLGFIVSTVYSLWMIQKTFHGSNQHNWKLPNLNTRETAIMVVMIAIILWLGIYPQPILNTAAPALQNMQSYAVYQASTSPVSPLPSGLTNPSLLSNSLPANPAGQGQPQERKP